MYSSQVHSLHTLLSAKEGLVTFEWTGRGKMCYFHPWKLLIRHRNTSREERHIHFSVLLLESRPHQLLTCLPTLLLPLSSLAASFVSLKAALKAAWAPCSDPPSSLCTTPQMTSHKLVAFSASFMLTTPKLKSPAENTPLKSRFKSPTECALTKRHQNRKQAEERENLIQHYN